jgi:histidyl-tRNA synthetase
MAASKTFVPPRGMRDFYPEDMRLRNTIFEAWRQASIQSGFLEYDACVVESLDLLKRKAGEEIVDQIYHFEDKRGRALALRPEMTPTLARMIAARQGGLSFPIRWFTMAQCFRYERMTRGRKREHYQWNLDIIGEESVAAEAEVIATAAVAMKTLGLDERHYRVRYNSRELLAELLAALGVTPEHHAAAFLALDKRGKIDDKALENLMGSEGIPTDQIPAVFKLLDVRSLTEAKQLLGTETPALATLNTFQTMLSSYGIADLCDFDIGVIRGLSYYTGIVFEAFDIKSQLRAIFGGGRYGKLLASIGGADMAGVGLGFGDVVIAELLADHGLDATEGTASLDLIIGFMQPEQHLTAIAIAATYRKRKKRVQLALSPEKPKSFFSRAGASGASHAIYLGPDDMESETLRIKNLSDRSQEVLSIPELLN